MKSNIKLVSLAAIAVLTLTYTSCKKSDTADDTSQFTSVSDDANRVTNETDAVANDATTAIEASPSLSGARVEGGGNLICDATVTYDTVSSTRTVTITYNGSNCYSTRTRTGVVTITMPVGVKWSNAGAAVTITFDNLKITRISDNTSIVINGSKTYTNVSGGLLKNLATVGHIEHQVSSSNMSITFDNGSTRTWNIARQRDFTYDNGEVISETGFGPGGEATWGDSRFGNAFSCTITAGQPVVEEQSCDWQITSGQVVFQRLDRTLTVTLGLDASGDAVTSCPGLGGFYWKATWTDAKGNAHQVIHRY